MKNILSALLTFLFPREHRKARIARLTSTDFLPSLHVSRRPIKNIYVTTLFSYEDTCVRDLIWSLKYETNQHAAELCAEMLAEVVFEELTELRTFEALPPLLLPIPLAPAREAERGYNQVAWIAQALIPRLHNSIELSAELMRTRHTPRQTTLSRQEREENVRGVFAVKNPEAIAGRHCIILDDVVTTGSTLTEAGLTLKAAGAKSVEYWAIAATGK